MVPRMEHCHAQLSGTVVVFMEPGVVRKMSEPVAVAKLASATTLAVKRLKTARRRKERGWTEIMRGGKKVYWI